MTAQTMDKVLWDGAIYFTEASVLERHGRLPDLEPTSSANWKGYVAAWAFVKRRLFLVHLSGILVKPGVDDSLSLFEVLFPEHREPVLADWFTGEMLLLGGEIEPGHEFDRLAEVELRLHIVAGSVVSESRTERKLPPPMPDPLLSRPISDLDLSHRLVAKLCEHGYGQIGALAQVDPLALLKDFGMNPIAVVDVRDALAARGLTMGQPIKGWTKEEA